METSTPMANVNSVSLPDSWYLGIGIVWVCSTNFDLFSATH